MPPYMKHLMRANWLLVQDLSARCARCRQPIHGRAALSPRRQRPFHLACALKATGLAHLVPTVLDQ